MLLLLPGLICDAGIYAAQTAAFPDSKAIDGYGLADSLGAMARIALDQAPERFDLFGHSMGGRVALEVYRLAPQRVRRLAISSTGAHSLRPGEPEKRQALLDIAANGGIEALIEAWLPPMVAPARRGDEGLMEPMRAMCRRAGTATFEAQIKALLARPEQESLLPQIACPMLVMTGSEDSWSPVPQHEAIAAAVPNSELVVVEGAGHMIMPEAPEAVNAAIAHWLSRPAED
ncbi:MAG: alpha/beta hydrolase [Candidatus Andeanibacterium colombiense]|uniref:Alpha/beta hydrolase n=1 Tax=Candidatus Andeanibacterium colombiense TaxID=3121345 RepID=A0AAJ6BM11_9SPHN|nr:MAG: alpha/beta hydrolase [Sphingomonadaceae bacterium]